MRIEKAIVIRRPVPEVFAFLRDVRNIPRWGLGVVEAEPVGTDEPGVGMRYRITSHLLGRRLERGFEITEYEENRKIGFRSTAGEVPSSGSYRLEDRGGTTGVTHVSQSEPGAFYDLAPDALRRVVERVLEANLGNLRDLLEG